MNKAHTIGISIVLLFSAFACAAKTDSTKTVLGNDEETFVFTGICPNGEPYRLVSYQKSIGALSSAYYDYDAPVGKGTVQSDAAPKAMAVRVCRKLAEIINTHYWE
ncbi:MAG: hypothetical protein RL406_209 [Pseudomonadota bacterium]|jgi:hypothetical protein